MLKPYIIGTYEGLSSRRISGTCCVYVSNVNEALSKLWALFNRGISAIYITEEFYTDARDQSDKDPHFRHHVKLLPSSQSGDIGTIKDIKLQAARASSCVCGDKESIAV